MCHSNISSKWIWVCTHNYTTTKSPNSELIKPILVYLSFGAFFGFVFNHLLLCCCFLFSAHLVVVIIAIVGWSHTRLHFGFSIFKRCSSGVRVQYHSYFIHIFILFFWNQLRFKAVANFKITVHCYANHMRSALHASYRIIAPTSWRNCLCCIQSTNIFSHLLDPLDIAVFLRLTLYICCGCCRYCYCCYCVSTFLERNQPTPILVLF